MSPRACRAIAIAIGIGIGIGTGTGTGIGIGIGIGIGCPTTGQRVRTSAPRTGCRPPGDGAHGPGVHGWAWAPIRLVFEHDERG
jgi:hypothetical protein